MPSVARLLMSCSTLALIVAGCGGGGGGASSSRYPVSVKVSGLASSETLTVLNNGMDSLTFTGDASRQFASTLAASAAYAVTISSQPADESCTVTGGTGQVAGPTTVSISCSLTPPSTIYPAFTPPYPLVTAFQGTAQVIANPRIIPVFFSDSPFQTNTVSFVQALIASNEWSVLGEYGVGPAVVAAPVNLGTAAPSTTTVAAVQQYVAANAESWATLGGSELFLLQYPATTKLTDISNIGGIHGGASTPSGQHVAWALMIYGNDAAGQRLFASGTYHEIAEAVTNPDSVSGYAFLNHDYTAWLLTGLAVEVADMCEHFALSTDPALGFEMQALWSNAAVMSGQPPCSSPVPSIAA